MSSNVGMRPGEELTGKVALVTGGARNIGRAICRSLAAGGASVMVNANTSKAMAEETVKMIGKSADVLSTFKPIDTVVDNIKLSEGLERIAKFSEQLVIDLAQASERPDVAKVERTSQEGGGRETGQERIQVAPRGFILLGQSQRGPGAHER